MDINTIISTVLQLILAVLGAYAGKVVHTKQKQNTVQQSLDITAQYAKDIVINLSQRSDLTNAEKFKKAFLYVVERVKKQGFDVTEQTITNKVIEAYQTYKKDGGDIHKFIPDFTEQQVNDAEQAVQAQSQAPVQDAQPVQATQPVQSQAPVQSAVATPVQPATEPAQSAAPVATDEPKETFDEPKSDGQVSDATVQQAPFNPYAK